MALEDDRLHATLAIELGRLVIVHRPPEDIGRAVGVEVDEPFDGARRRRRRREDADLSQGRLLERRYRGESGHASGSALEEVAPARARGLARVLRRGGVAPLMAAAADEAPSGKSKRIHAAPPR